MSLTWKQESLIVIEAEYRRRKTPDMPYDKLLKIISRECYPFGPKSGYPYKAWLAAIRDYSQVIEPAEMREVKGPLFQ